MRARTLAKGFVLAVGLLVIVGCASTSPEFPTGEFVDTEGNVVNWMGDGRSTVVLSCCPEDLYEMEYSVDGDNGDIIIVFASELCTRNGVYRWNLDGDELQFEIVSDNCGVRLGLTIRGMTRISEDR